MSVKCVDIFNIMENLAPSYLAEGWDNRQQDGKSQAEKRQGFSRLHGHSSCGVEENRRWKTAPRLGIKTGKLSNINAKLNINKYKMHAGG